MDNIIFESQMNLGYSDDANIYRIERDADVAGLYENGIKSVELIRKQGRRLIFIEAKTSCPNRTNREKSEEAKQSYNEYVNEICQKFQDSVQLYMALRLGVRTSADIPEAVGNVALGEDTCRLVLVVKNAEDYWLEGYQEEFSQRMADFLRIWRITNVFVINEDRAKRKGFVF